MKDNNIGCFGWLFFIAALIISVLFGRWFFETVMESNLPDWLKYLLLK